MDGSTADRRTFIKAFRDRIGINPKKWLAATSLSSSRGHLSLCFTLVRTAGLEPALPYEKQILSLLRIPFRHVRFG